MWEGRRREVSPYPDLRRFAVAAARPGEGLFTEPTAVARLGSGNRAISSTNLHPCKPPEASGIEARVTKVARGLGKVLGVRR